MVSGVDYYRLDPNQLLLMPICVRAAGAFFAIVLLALLSFSPLRAQQRLDLGVHFTPQTLLVHSEPRQGVGDDALVYSEGGGGVAVGFGAGAYLEYEVCSGLSVRAGADLARKRYAYDVRRSQPNTGEGDERGVNRVIFVAMEVPVSVVYRFGSLRNGNGLLIGFGGVVTRFIGDPQLETAFFGGSSNDPPISYSPHALRVLAGYERYVSSRFLFGIEPYVSYSPRPTEFRLESRTTAVANLEAGISLTLRFDN